MNRQKKPGDEGSPQAIALADFSDHLNDSVTSPLEASTFERRDAMLHAASLKKDPAARQAYLRFNDELTKPETAFKFKSPGEKQNEMSGSVSAKVRYKIDIDDFLDYQNAEIDRLTHRLPLKSALNSLCFMMGLLLGVSGLLYKIFYL